MSRKGASHFLASSGPNEEALEEGFRWLVSKSTASGNRGLVAVMQKQVLDNIVHWSKLAPLLTQLKNHGAAKVGDANLELLTSRDKSVHHWDGPILAIYGGQKLLDIVDSIAGNASVLVVPWTETDHLEWASTWNAVPIGQETDDPVTEPTSGVVLIALQDLTNSVNLGTGIVHSSDRETAVRTLETLFHKNASVTPEVIRRQLVRLGWEPKDATEVRNLADMIWDGRRPKGSTGKPDDALWGYWNSKVGEAENG